MIKTIKSAVATGPPRVSRVFRVSTTNSGLDRDMISEQQQPREKFNAFITGSLHLPRI